MLLRWPLPCALNHLSTSSSTRIDTGVLLPAAGMTSLAVLKNASSTSGMSEVSMSLSAMASISAKRFFEIMYLRKYR